MIQECSAVRQREWRNEYENSKLRGEYIYAQFVLDCIAKGHREWIEQASKFGDWLKAEKIELTFWQKKAIDENHFGYKYEYDHDKENWE